MNAMDFASVGSDSLPLPNEHRIQITLIEKKKFKLSIIVHNSFP